VFTGEEREEQVPDKNPAPTTESDALTIHHRPRTANTAIAPWEAQKPPPVEQLPKVAKKKSEYPRALLTLLPSHYLPSHHLPAHPLTLSSTYPLIHLPSHPLTLSSTNHLTTFT
jgi:hypothetical protein